MPSEAKPSEANKSEANESEAKPACVRRLPPRCVLTPPLPPAPLPQYMFFEGDDDMCGMTSDNKPYINLCNVYVGGCVCPCRLVLKGNDQ